MLFNTATFTLFLILFGVFLILVILLVAMGIISKNNPTSKALIALKIFTILIALVVGASAVATPLCYHQFIELDIHFGVYQSVTSSDYYDFHRDSVDVHISGSSEINGTWSLKENKLTVVYGYTVKQYTVQDLGTELYEDGVLAFKYRG